MSSTFFIFCCFSQKEQEEHRKCPSLGQFALLSTTTRIRQRTRTRIYKEAFPRFARRGQSSTNRLYSLRASRRYEADASSWFEPYSMITPKKGHPLYGGSLFWWAIKVLATDASRRYEADASSWFEPCSMITPKKATPLWGQPFLVGHQGARDRRFASL